MARIWRSEAQNRDALAEAGRNGCDYAAPPDAGTRFAPAEIVDINAMLNARRAEEHQRNFAEADRIRSALATQFSIAVDDQTRTWGTKTFNEPAVGGHNGGHNAISVSSNSSISSRGGGGGNSNNSNNRW